ncbi:hypothetical protein JCGZ_14380 [Jatropha curcas]|uniref:LDLR chaperone MESD n=1 Tax=Jatropha curcas TaxID=180498 RepID=A0A067K9W7_JATCU|nr:uncharacterized protein LOC105642965 [Jatropha curcas]KDP28609.1 hypothetical protein JCGZ_14380 [Jatropha curcas]
MTNLHIITLLLLPLIFSQNGQLFRFAEGGKRKIHITDDLDGVIDDEEDEAWKQWGQPSTRSSDESDLPPSELDKMDVWQIQEFMKKQQYGQVFGFVKLRLGVRRTQDTVAEIAMKWTKVLRTGAIGVKFTGVDSSTIMFNLEKARHTKELKEFIFNEPESYEIKIGDKVYRRPGDPPLEEVIEQLRSEKVKGNVTTPSKDNEHVQQEL